MSLNPYILPDMSIGRVPPEVVRWPGQVDFVLLTAHTGVTLTIPTDANYVKITPNKDLFVNYQSSTITSPLYTASSISVSVCAGLKAELIPANTPTMRVLTGLTKMGIISPVAASVTLAWYI